VIQNFSKALKTDSSLQGYINQEMNPFVLMFNCFWLIFTHTNITAPNQTPVLLLSSNMKFFIFQLIWKYQNIVIQDKKEN